MSRSRWGSVLVLGLLLAASAALLVRGTVDSRSPTTLAERTRAVAVTLRCPICHDLSVADSPSTLARQMRDRVRRELAAGQTPAQVRAGFVASYGPSVLLSPPRRGLAGTVWLVPVLLLVGGAGAAGVLLQRWMSGAAPPVAPLPSPAQRSSVERALRTLERDGRDEEGSG